MGKVAEAALAVTLGVAAVAVVVGGGSRWLGRCLCDTPAPLNGWTDAARWEK